MGSVDLDNGQRVWLNDHRDECLIMPMVREFYGSTHDVVLPCNNFNFHTFVRDFQ